MMDLKDIIKWFIPCFHILLLKKRKMSKKIVVICLFLFFNIICAEVSDVVSENSLVQTKNVGDSLSKYVEAKSEKYNQSDNFAARNSKSLELRTFGTTSVGRTFGRPFKKMMAGLIPVIFQLGMASTWAVVAALVGVKTLVVTLVILKILLTAGAAKVGALFASKHESHHHEPHPQKEIHLHIHNGHGQYGHEHHEEISSWNREGHPLQDSKLNYVIDPYRVASGPQTISTPYGTYVKVDPAPNVVI
ncbi:uncharacterized protein LOC126378503 [Pectinophora gossypiella]|uniref:uncharacterized protein LOC126378503 n=1 Tax=Pectinophora gossypiella TaxID=13191 RepID=UPI00214DFAAB|nr:uncharacterized protein LOC126378503 [Pectinophora gossypiella]